MALLLGIGPAGAAPPLRLERVVLLMRHGVRPPTHEPALSTALAPAPWPGWEVPNGFLTPRGARAITLLASYDREIFAPLFTTPCPDILIYADVDERTVATGVAFAAGLAPRCGVTVQHAAGKDPLFSALDNAGFDARAADSAMRAAAGGGPQAFIAAHAPLYRMMQQTLQPGGSAFLNLPGALVANPGHPPKLTGPIAEGSSGAEDFLLEYLDDKPMQDVAWGRADEARMLKLLALHPLAYTITARPAVIARATAGLLARRILAGLTRGPVITVLVGHDTNQAELGGLLNLHWAAGGYPADDPPPGGGIIFSLFQDPAGRQFVTATYQVQTPDQIRGLVAPGHGGDPALVALRIPGCGDAVAPTACAFANFAALIRKLSS